MLRNEVDIVAVLADECDNNLAALAVCGAGRALDACGGQIAGVGLVVNGEEGCGGLAGAALAVDKGLSLVLGVIVRQNALDNALSKAYGDLPSRLDTVP